MSGRLAALLVAAALATAACTSSLATSTGHGGPTPSPSLAADWTTMTDAAGGFSVGVPPGWVGARRDDATLTAILAAITASHAELGAYLKSELTGSGAPTVAAVVANPDTSASHYVSSLAVTRLDAGPVAGAPSLDTLVRQKLANIDNENDVQQPVTKTAASLPAGPAQKLAYTVNLAGQRQASVTVYLLTTTHGGHEVLYELVLAHLAPDVDAATLETAAATFRLRE